MLLSSCWLSQANHLIWIFAFVVLVLLGKRYDNDFFRLWNRTKDKVVTFLMRVNSYILYIVPRYEHYPRLKYQNQNWYSWTQKCTEAGCLSGNRQLTSNASQRDENLSILKCLFVSYLRCKERIRWKRSVTSLYG